MDAMTNTKDEIREQLVGITNEGLMMVTLTIVLGCLQNSKGDPMVAAIQEELWERGNVFDYRQLKRSQQIGADN